MKEIFILASIHIQDEKRTIYNLFSVLPTRIGLLFLKEQQVLHKLTKIETSCVAFSQQRHSAPCERVCAWLFVCVCVFCSYLCMRIRVFVRFLVMCIRSHRIEANLPRLLVTTTDGFQQLFTKKSEVLSDQNFRHSMPQITAPNPLHHQNYPTKQ